MRTTNILTLDELIEVGSSVVVGILEYESRDARRALNDAFAIAFAPITYARETVDSALNSIVTSTKDARASALLSLTNAIAISIAFALSARTLNAFSFPENYYGDDPYQ